MKKKDLEFTIEVSEKPDGKSNKEIEKAKKKIAKEKKKFEKEQKKIEKEKLKKEKEQKRLEKENEKFEKEQIRLQKINEKFEKEQNKLEKKDRKSQKVKEKLQKKEQQVELTSKEEKKFEKRIKAQKFFSDEEEDAEEELEDDIDEEDEEGKTYEKNDKLVVRLLFIILIVLISAIALIMFKNDTFNIENINVKIGKNVSTSEVCKCLEDGKGQNIFLFDTLNYEERIKNNFPYIKSVKITRDFPNSLTVSYEEREPYLLLEYNSDYVICDKFGNILDIVKETVPDIPTVKGIVNSEVKAGGFLIGTSEIKYNNIVYLLENLSHLGYDFEISDIDYEDTENLKFKIKNKNLTFIYGNINKEILVDKLTSIKDLIKEIGEDEGTVDISTEKMIFKKVI